jgi:23S rRNA pseudouridine1911/1915/1917 synthase
MGDQLVIFQYHEKEPQRLDKFLVLCLPGFSRSRLQGLIKEGRVSVDGSVAGKSGQILEGLAEVRVAIPPSQPGRLLPEPIPIDIIFENQDLIVINKPAGMVVHPAAGHSSGTLVQAALAHAPEMEGIGGEQRPGVVHRLDKNTSGLILLAKNDAAHRWLVDQFRTRRAQKIYLALVDGKPPSPTGRVETPIGRSPSQRKLMAVVAPQKGREAVTEYRVIETFPLHTLLEVHPITGRTHQIRIHLEFLGCPVVGDTVYGRHQPSLPLGHQFLHAARLSIRLPGETEPSTFEAPLPPDLSDILTGLRAKTLK